VINYIKSSIDELMNKVSWPTLSQLQSSSLVVGVCSVIIAVVIYLMDLGSQNLFEQFFNLFK